MKVDWVNPFIRATGHVLAEVAALERPHIGTLAVEDGPFSADEVTAMISLDGRLQGVVLFTMARTAAEALVERMVGQHLEVEERLAESALGEMANMIAGYALGFLENVGLTCTISAPVVLRGSDTVVTMTPSARLVVPLAFPQTEMRLVVALHES